MSILRWIAYGLISVAILGGVLVFGVVAAIVMGILLLIAAGICVLLFISFIVKDWWDTRRIRKQKSCN